MPLPGYGHDTIKDFRLFDDRLNISGFNALPTIALMESGVDMNFGAGDVLSFEWDAGPARGGNDLFNRVAGRWTGRTP